MMLQLLSGGQTGVDRAVLVVAERLGLPISGWCPRGRWAEDGPIPDRWPLVETPAADPAQRTWWNVYAAAEIWVLIPTATWTIAGGTRETIRAARWFRRSLRLLPLDGPPVRPSRSPLLVAGPRESEAPGVERTATRWLLRALAPARGPETSS